MASEYDVGNFDEIRISLASAEDIRSWSHGEVKKPETINYRTLKPEKDGLFCEKIFGPTRDWECACGKYRRNRFKGIVCERCGVEVTRSKARRERMGHIELAAPVSHIWYFKEVPSRLGYFLDISTKDLEKVLYFASYMITWVDEEAREEDKDELAEELEEDLEELDAECEKIIEDTRKLSTEYTPDEDEIVDDVYEEERLTPEEVESEILSTKEEFDEQKELRREAYKTFMKIKPKQLVEDESVYREMRACYRDYFRGGMGAEVIRDLLEQQDIHKLHDELDKIVKNGRGPKRDKAIKRIKIINSFIDSKTNKPSDMILDVIPVIPPDLRPMVQLDGGRFATSDLNDLYRRVINRNSRLKKLLDLGAPEIIVNNEKRMLQEAVDSLFYNGKRGRAVTGPGSRPLKSLTDMLKGKQGRFRQNLLGKRVDYSGRSVIVVGPTLKLHQCGLPTQMALELFKPFVMRRLVELDYVANIKAAKRAVEIGPDYVFDVLEDVVAEHPVLLNRAPTLHRLGIQAFEPVLVEGKAIRLHPLVCTAFNADFDGDQMAVHVPLGSEAQAEARVLMLSTNNIKAPAHGRPLTVPTQDMIIGLYYLTAVRAGFPGEGRKFIDFADAIDTYEARSGLDLQAEIDVRLKRDTVVVEEDKTYKKKAGDHIKTSAGRIIFNDVLPNEHEFLNYSMNKSKIGDLVNDIVAKYPMSDVPEILDGLKAKGFHYATLAGLTVSVFDATVPPEKQKILDEAEKKVNEIEGQFEMGLMDEEDRYAEIVNIWMNANDEVGDAMANNFDQFNPIYMMANSGARGDIKQIRQLAGMRGLMSNPKGEIIDRPIKANFREGLSVLEYFISTHGARKGLADTALRTAESGYLTRRLVDVSQDTIVREIDCGTHQGVDYDVLTEKGRLNEGLIGRCLNEDVADLFKRDDYITSTDDIQKLVDAGIKTVNIRTVMTCHAKQGVCQKCYGWDLATARPVNIGTAVGIIAAQSIGEPGTQLTMRTFHSGGIANEDITQGLPRVQELLEARKNPKGVAVLSPINGTLQVKETKENKHLTVHNDDGDIFEKDVSKKAHLMDGIKNGAAVTAGTQLTKGPIDPHELLELTDAATTLNYIVEEVQNVYKMQGVSINDKHVEVITRQMLNKKVVLEAGDSDLIPGNTINRFEFDDVVQDMIDQGKEVPVGRDLLQGLTKASLSTDSWISAASFQQTTKVLTEAAISGKTDCLAGLKENVCMGKHIPAGTGLKRYRNIGLKYKGESVGEFSEDELPESAPESLRDLEKMIPKNDSWSIDSEGYLHMGLDGAPYYDNGKYLDRAKITNDEARLYLYDDLGVSQRWANKFSEASIETVGDLIGHTEKELLKIEGIGVKAMEELKTGLKKKDLLHVIEDDLEATDEDVSSLLDIVFAPDNSILVDSEDTPSITDEKLAEEILGNDE
ncbi:MAG: DNA-directed RNA polymerase subunit beta' [Coriobacteriia bacterium]|nr:DNA-directed RNA polymerase subunit beta' [Coriobacteriia bacterium]